MFQITTLFSEYVRTVPTNGRYLPVMAPTGAIYIVTPANELVCYASGEARTYTDFGQAWADARLMLVLENRENIKPRSTPVGK